MRNKKKMDKRQEKKKREIVKKNEGKSQGIKIRNRARKEVREEMGMVLTLSLRVYIYNNRYNNC